MYMGLERVLKKKIGIKMDSTTARTPVKSGEATSVSLEQKTPSTGQVDDKVQVPYTEYKKANSRPYVADYFELGDLWKDPQSGKSPEVENIEQYFMDKINSGELANDTNVIKEELKKMEKLNNISKEPRAVVKMGILSAHIEFLKKSENIKLGQKK